MGTIMANIKECTTGRCCDAVTLDGEESNR